MSEQEVICKHCGCIGLHDDSGVIHNCKTVKTTLIESMRPKRITLDQMFDELGYEMQGQE